MRAKLSARDAALLKALARFRIARTSDLLSLIFSTVRRDTAARRLRRLFDAAYLDVISNDRAEENTYHLGRAGRAWIAAQGGKSGTVPKGGHVHHLAIVHVWSAVAACAARLPNLRLELFRPDWEIREQAGMGQPAVVPDALVQLCINRPDQESRRHRFALEVDLGTERVPVIRRKLESYRVTAVGDGLFGWQSFGLVLYLADPSNARRQGIEKLLREEWPGWSVVWQSESDITGFVERIAGFGLIRPPTAAHACRPSGHTLERSRGGASPGRPHHVHHGSSLGRRQQ